MGKTPVTVTVKRTRRKRTRKPWNPEVRPWEDKNIKASTVLAGALEFWGQEGERWVKNSLGYERVSACLIGGLNGAAYGDAQGEYYPQSLPHENAVKRAKTFLLDELEARGFKIRGMYHDSDLAEPIITFNDARSRKFDEVRDLTCKALKRALEAELKEEQATKKRRVTRRKNASK